MPKFRADLSAKYIRSILRYERKTGKFFWKKPRKRIRVGDRAGGFRNGRWIIEIDGKRYAASRLAWVYVTGQWPEHEIDHKNLDASDDRFRNLRPATHAQNLCNVALNSRNTSGIKGVSWDRSRQKWIVIIRSRGRAKNLGRFTNRRVAQTVYRSAAREIHGKFARVS